MTTRLWPLSFMMHILDFLIRVYRIYLLGKSGCRILEVWLHLSEIILGMWNRRTLSSVLSRIDSVKDPFVLNPWESVIVSIQTLVEISTHLLFRLAFNEVFMTLYFLTYLILIVSGTIWHDRLLKRLLLLYDLRFDKWFLTFSRTIHDLLEIKGLSPHIILLNLRLTRLIEYVIFFSNHLDLLIHSLSHFVLEQFLICRQLIFSKGSL